MITKVIRIFGILLIIGFAVVSIFFSLAERDIEDPRLKALMSYPSFFEDRFYDIRMNMTLDDSGFDKRIVLAKIDDESLQKVGRWPWSRATWAQFIRKVQAFGGKIIAYDVFFPEPEMACNAESPDLEMARAIAEFQSIPGNKVILPYSLYDFPSDQTFEEVPDTLYNFIMDTKQAEGLDLKPHFVSNGAYPIPTLNQAEPLLGHIGAKEDPDGIFRHYQLVANVDTLYFPSFALLAYQAYSSDSASLEMLSVGNNLLKIKPGNSNLNYKGETKVRWFGSSKNFPQVSIHEVLKAKDDDKKMHEIFKDNIIFIGSTAYGAHDLRHTPVDAMMPGIYFHMNMTRMLLEGEFFKPQDESTLISWAILIGATLLIIIIQLFGNALVDLFSVIAITATLFLADTYYLLPQGYETKLFFCLFSVIFCYSWTTFLNFYLTSKDKHFLKNAFGNYISPELIDEMYKSGEPPRLGGDAGIRTAYFTDIQKFSTFSEQLTATQLVELLNEYLTAMTDILLEEKGTLDKYEGDAIIAFFGAPMPLEDHAARACMVAHRMQEKLLELREKWKSEGDKWPQIVHDMRMRIGINSGEIVTGNMGSKSRMNYTMMGDSVNLAARLEEAAKQYGIFTQISQFTNELLDDSFEFRELDTVQVVGKSEPVTTYDLLGLKGEIDENLAKLKETFHRGIMHYKAQEWDEAIVIFEQALKYEHIRFPELEGKMTNPSEIYIKRCHDFKENPPAKDWNGVYTLTSK